MYLSGVARMIDIEKAINYWKQFKKEIKKLREIKPGAEWDEQEKATDLAISALEKQIPKKVKYKTTCPTCNTYNSVWNKRTNTKPGDIVYCWHCGNAIKLDWSVEE